MNYKKKIKKDLKKKISDPEDALNLDSGFLSSDRTPKKELKKLFKRK